MKIIAIILLSLSFFSTAYAEFDFDRIDVHVTSSHLKHSQYLDEEGEKQDFNEKNIGVGVAAYYNDYLEGHGGLFMNSYDTMSAYWGVTLKKDFYIKNLIITPGVDMNILLGYDNTPLKTDTAIVEAHPSIRLGHTKTKISALISYFPTSLIRENGADSIVLSLGYQFK